MLNTTGDEAWFRPNCVTIGLRARKVRVDSVGIEREVPLTEIGVFAASLDPYRRLIDRDGSNNIVTVKPSV